MIKTRTRAHARRLLNTAAAITLAAACYLIGTTAALPDTRPCHGKPRPGCHWHQHTVNSHTFGHTHYHRHTKPHRHRHARPLTLTRPTPVPHRRLASCYGPGLFGNSTANGTTLTPSTLGVAMRYEPLGSRITLAANGRRITVRVIDRGPYSGNRSIDLTHATAQRLGYSSCTAFGVRTIRTSR